MGGAPPRWTGLGLRTLTPYAFSYGRNGACGMVSPVLVVILRCTGHAGYPPGVTLALLRKSTGASQRTREFFHERSRAQR